MRRRPALAAALALGLVFVFAGCEPEPPCPEGQQKTLVACQLDDNVVDYPCTTPVNYQNLEPGVHTAHVYAVTLACIAGNWVSSPLGQDSRTWTVEQP